MSARGFPIEAGQILVFARAIGDPNPVYADAEQARRSEAGGIIAPPTFATAAAHFDPEYRFRPKPGKPWFGSGREASGAPPREGGGGTGLHAEQHYEYHRALRPGDVLTETTRPGRTWEKEGRRSGKLLFTETISEFHDARGELVLTARSVGVRTERVVDQGAR